jgi:formate dehydrogenase maturation protein FdhE
MDCRKLLYVSLDSLQWHNIRAKFHQIMSSGSRIHWKVGTDGQTNINDEPCSLCAHFMRILKRARNKISGRRLLCGCK